MINDNRYFIVLTNDVTKLLRFTREESNII